MNDTKTKRILENLRESDGFTHEYQRKIIRAMNDGKISSFADVSVFHREDCAYFCNGCCNCDAILIHEGIKIG